MKNQYTISDSIITKIWNIPPQTMRYTDGGPRIFPPIPCLWFLLPPNEVVGENEGGSDLKSFGGRV